MPTQTFAFGYTTGQTLTAKLFAVNGDEVIATASAVAELDEAKGRYLAQFEDVAAGRYRMVIYLGEIGVSSELYTLTETDAVFSPWSEYEPQVAKGLYRLTVSVVDAVEDTVPGAIVQIVGVAGTTRTTGTAGESLIDLDPGPYTLRVTVPAGYESVPDRTIEIIDEDIAEVIELVSTVFLPSEAAPYCMTRFAVQDQFTETAEGTLIDVEFVRFLPGATRTAVVISPSEPLVTGAEGYVDRKLNRLAEYSAKYAVPGKVPKSLRFTTPDAGSYEVVEP